MCKEIKKQSQYLSDGIKIGLHHSLIGSEIYFGATKKDNCVTMTTTTTTSPIVIRGYPGTWFHVIHGVAIGSVSLSIFGSIYVIVFIHLHGIGRKLNASFWKWSIAERLILYLSVVNIACATCQLLDHMHWITVHYFPEAAICDDYSFAWHYQLLFEMIVTMVALVQAWFVHKRDSELFMGKFDYRLVFPALLFPFVVTRIMQDNGLLGPSDSMCFIDMRASSDNQRLYLQSFWIPITILLGLQLLNFIFLQSTASLSIESQLINLASVKALNVFGLITVGHWWSLAMYALDRLINNSVSDVVNVIAIALANMGGIYYFVGYVFIRKQLESAIREETAEEPIKWANDVSCSSSGSDVTVDRRPGHALQSVLEITI